MANVRRPGPTRSPAALVFIVGAVIVSGCAHERVSVTVGKNGTWTRRATYIVTKLDTGPSAAKSDDVGDAFALPTGEGWKLTKQTTKDETRVIAERTLPLDGTIENDIVVKEQRKLQLPGQKPQETGAKLVRDGDNSAPLKTLTSNSVTVRQVSPGRYEYKETIHWTGDPPTMMSKLDKKEIELVRAALPADLATDENVKTVSDVLSRQLDLALIGPPSPMVHRLPMLMSAPDTFARLLSRRVGKTLVSSIQARFGDRMTSEQCRSIAARLVSGITEEIKASGPDQAGEAQGGDNSQKSSGTGLFISVRLPGRIVETNGLVNNFNNEITWSFYPEAAAVGDVTLTATCDTSTKSAPR